MPPKAKKLIDESNEETKPVKISKITKKTKDTEVLESKPNEDKEITKTKETKEKETKPKKKVSGNGKGGSDKKKSDTPESTEKYSGKQVIIVESPNKIKKIKEILEKIKKHPNFEDCDFVVTASVGHIEGIIPTKVGICLKTFEPQYVICENKHNVVEKLIDEVRDASMVWLAADDDREGTSICYSLKKLLKLSESEYQRIVFNEITEKAILYAFLHPTKIDMNMYHSQKARAVADKLIGYLISPLLDKTFNTFGLACGRVQSVATKMVCEREKEIEKFESSGFYQVTGTFTKAKNKITIAANLDQTLENKEKAFEFLELGNTAKFKIIDISVNKTKRHPPAPYITSTIQQDLSSKMGISPDKTMSILQSLFEKGHITYHRTDSFMLSQDSKNEIKELVNENFGEEYYHNNFYANKGDSQAAHEAIRPTHFDVNYLADVSSTENKVYQMIFKRTIASQMAAADVQIKTIKIGMDNSIRIFLTKAEQIIYKGFLAIYESDKSKSSNKSKTDESESYLDTRDTKNGNGDGDEDEDEDNNILDESELYEILSKLEVGDELKYKTLKADEKFSKPIARFTESSLIKFLESKSIGRPSTYASIISKIQDAKRNYVRKMDAKGVKKDVYTLQYSNGKYSEKTVSITSGAVKDKLFALEVGKTVTEFLEKNFGNLVEYEFTKSIEEDLDMIASGQKIWTDIVKKVYDSFAQQIEHIRENAASIEGGGKIKKYLGVNPNTGADMSIIFNKSGPSIYTELANGEKKYCNITDNEVMDMTIEKAIDLLKYPIMLKAPINLGVENDIEICKGKTNYYLKQNKKSIPLTDNVDTEPDVITWAVANELFKNNAIQSTSRILRTFDEDKKLSIVNARYGPCIEYAGKVKKIFVAIPKGKTYQDLTFEDCAILVNKKKESDKKGKGKVSTTDAKKKPRFAKKQTS